MQPLFVFHIYYLFSDDSQSTARLIQLIYINRNISFQALLTDILLILPEHRTV